MRVYTRTIDYGHMVDIAIIRENPDGSSYLGKFDEYGLLDFTEKYEKEITFTEMTQTMRIPMFLADQIVQALGQIGVRPRSESYIEGELKATKLHLQDLRNQLNLLEEKKNGSENQ